MTVRPLRPLPQRCPTRCHDEGEAKAMRMHARKAMRMHARKDVAAGIPGIWRVCREANVFVGYSPLTFYLRIL
jgi:hypothetical protein